MTIKVKLGIFTLFAIITVLLVLPVIKVSQFQILLEQSAIDCHTKIIKNSAINRHLLLYTLNKTEKDKVVFLKDVREDGDKIMIETIYDSGELNEYFEAEAIDSVDDFNRFIDGTDFEPIPVCYSPVDLFTSHKGNCYAYTLFTMFYLSKYHPELLYEPVFEYYDEGDSHIYLLIKNDENQVVCDLTRDKQLVLPE